jgi:hypothetical protein
MGLADEVLALHDAIQYVLLVENRAGEMHIVGQAGRNNSSPVEAMTEAEKDSIVAPAMILGAASQIGKVWRYGELRLVGMLYTQLASLCAPVDDDTYLMLTTTTENLPAVMNTVQQALPSLMRKRATPTQTLAISSAVEVDQAVRSFFANTRLCEPNLVRMDHAILNPNDQRWQVAGSYRPSHAIRSKHYQIELDAKTGAVTRFETGA